MIIELLCDYCSEIIEVEIDSDYYLNSEEYEPILEHKCKECGIINNICWKLSHEFYTGVKQ